jgi:hypothetical protein
LGGRPGPGSLRSGGRGLKTVARSLQRPEPSSTIDGGSAVARRGRPDPDGRITPRTTPLNHDLGLVAAIVGGVALVSILANLILLQQRARQARLRRDAEAKLEELRGRLRKHAAKTPKFQSEYVDAIVMGPRLSGKSSIVGLWTVPWTKIEDVGATEHWADYVLDIHCFEPSTVRDDLFDSDRTLYRTLKIRLRDNPGEVDQRVQAIQHLASLKKRVVLIFVLRVGFDRERNRVMHAMENDEYFSAMLVEEIQNHVQRVSASVQKVMVVFNKVDLLPADWDEARAKKALMDANSRSVHQIETLFGGSTEYHLVSAQTNQGIVALLGSVGRVVMDLQRGRNGLASSLKSLEDQFRARGV